MDFNRISRGGLIVAAAGGLYFIFSLFHWYKACVTVISQNQCYSGGTGWSTPISVLASLVVIALVAEVIAVEAAGVTLASPSGPTLYKIRLGLAVFVVLAVLLSIVVNSGTTNAPFGLGGVATKPTFALFIAVILAAALAYGEFLRKATVATLPPGGQWGPPQPPPGQWGPTPPAPGGYGTPPPPPPGGYGGPTPPPPPAPPSGWNPNP